MITAISRVDAAQDLCHTNTSTREAYHWSRNFRDFDFARVLTALGLALLAGLALGVGLILDRTFHIHNVLLVFLPVVLLAAVRHGFLMAFWVSLVSVLGSSFFLDVPHYSFLISDSGDLWALVIFLLVAGFTSRLAAQARQRTAAANHHSKVAEQLYGFSSKLAGASSIQEMQREIAHQLGKLFETEVLVVMRDGEGFRASDADGAEASLGACDPEAIRACFEGSTDSGSATGGDGVPGFRFWPLETSRGVIALVGLRLIDAKEPVMPELRLLDALREQAAVNLERAQLAEEMRLNEVRAEKEKLRSALLTSISHDFRTPLASILGNVSSLRQYGHLYDDDTRAEMLDLAESETLRLARFVDNLLHMTRIDAGALHPTLEMIDLGDVVGSTLARLEKPLSRHKVRIETTGELPMVPSDFLLMEQVIANLLDNAAKYAPPGSLIEVNLKTVPCGIEVHVRDEGPGIPGAELARIFQRFHRVSAGDHRPAGAGLGLAICKGFIEALGGQIEVTNRKDRSGCDFTVSLPISKEVCK